MIQSRDMHVNEAPECMRIFGFIHGITNLDLIKKLNDNIPKSVDEMMSVTTAFLRGEVAVANQSRKKVPPTWRHHETSHKLNFDKRPDFKNRHKLDLTNGILGGGRALHEYLDELYGAYGMLKFLVEGGIVTLYSNVIIPVECRMVAEALSELPPNEPAIAERIKVAIHLEYLEQTITISGSLLEKVRMELYDVLRNNLDIFA
uniref:Reverse transcriptase domain-containing protein n=1 Tax=Tanacetum cinerariifolium TaxID=118510 RepID=A0A699J9E4_TANCI|nr:reverse transcriptase domain-containing protein [Tanacetum cinerariifolium]